MTASTSVALGPLATVLPLLTRAGRSRHVIYTLAPDELRPPRITIELDSSTEVQHFAAAIQLLTEAVPAQNVGHLAIVLDELVGRAVARWTAPRATDDPWYHSRAAAHALAAAAEQPHASPYRRSALAQAAACALAAIADWDRRAAGRAGNSTCGGSAASEASPPTMDDIIGEMVAEGGTLASAEWQEAFSRDHANAFAVAQAACADGLAPAVKRGPVMTCATCAKVVPCPQTGNDPCWHTKEAGHV